MFYLLVLVVVMRSNVENMPYLRNMNKATKIARANLQKASSKYQRLHSKRDELIVKGREYLYRARRNENEGLHEKGQTFIAKANKINSKMLLAYQKYKDAENKLSKLSQ